MSWKMSVPRTCLARGDDRGGDDTFTLFYSQLQFHKYTRFAFASPRSPNLDFGPAQ